MRAIKDVLIQEFNLSGEIENWTLLNATEISADGRTIVGTGGNPEGRTEAWRAMIPRR
ncbi:MAG: hypothetical protein IPM64_10270 [Phycisphaerales bacterium]|nr:hypothetical protein [Phycisphaerales bacterium]